MTHEYGTALQERETAQTATELQTYSINFKNGCVNIVVTGKYVEGQPIVLVSEKEDCAIHFDQPVFEHDIYWLEKARRTVLLPLHAGSTFQILRPVESVSMILNGRPIGVNDGPRIPTVTGNGNGR